jgi:hypothetical protein
MIVVRADLLSTERISLEAADSFTVEDGNLLVFEGDERVALFRSWAYVIKTDKVPDLESAPPVTLATSIPAVSYRPLNVGAPTKPLVS